MRDIIEGLKVLDRSKHGSREEAQAINTLITVICGRAKDYAGTMRFLSIIPDLEVILAEADSDAKSGQRGQASSPTDTTTALDSALAVIRQVTDCPDVVITSVDLRHNNSEGTLVVERDGILSTAVDSSGHFHLRLGWKVPVDIQRVEQGQQ